MVNKIRTIIFIVIGIISIGLSIRCYSYKAMEFTEKSMYGGDAFTGIQNAGAQTSENVSGLACIVQFGFGSVLLVAGLGFLGVGLTSPLGKKQDEENSIVEEEDTTSVDENTPKLEQSQSE